MTERRKIMQKPTAPVNKDRPRIIPKGMVDVTVSVPEPQVKVGGPLPDEGVPGFLKRPPHRYDPEVVRDISVRVYKVQFPATAKEKLGKEELRAAAGVYDRLTVATLDAIHAMGGVLPQIVK